MEFDLDRKVALHQCGDDWGKVAETPDWTGALGAFWADNPMMTYSDIAALCKAMDRDGWVVLGGGAQGCFTMKPVPAEETLEQRLARALGTMLDSFDDGERVDDDHPLAEIRALYAEVTGAAA